MHKSRLKTAADADVIHRTSEPRTRRTRRTARSTAGRESVASAVEETRGDRIIRFIERYLIVPDGASVGHRIVLREWQKDTIHAIYDSPTRRAILSFGRKNGKTAFAAMLVLVHLIGPEARRNAQIFSAAQSRDQAAIVFGLASKMIRMSELHDHVIVRETAKQLVCPLTGVVYRALSADATTAYGLSPVFVIHDELGQVRGPRSELYDALETACGAQVEPLSMVISTQAPTDADLLSLLIDDANTNVDPTIKCFLYAADKDDDPWSEASWRKANPALGDFRSLSDVEEMARSAQRLPSQESSFRNLILNQRVASENHFLSAGVWNACSDPPSASLLKLSKFPVYAGLDLSGARDLTAFVIAGKDNNGVVHVWPFFWAPSEGLRERARADRVPYDVWVREGLLDLTPGASIDYSFVAKRVAELSAQFNVAAVRFDRWRIEDMRRELSAIGCKVPLEEHGQGFRDMAPALDRLESIALNKALRHGGHPVLTWCASNAVAVKDAAGNRKLDKSRAMGRIDGLVALAMAVSSQKQEPAVEFPYHARGIRSINLGASL